jgi:hypothetical protein
MIPSRSLLSTVVMIGIVLPRPPTFAYVHAVGCNDVLLMAWNKDSSEVLSITVSKLPTNGRQATFDLKDSTERVRLRVEALEGTESFRRCGLLGRGLTDIQDPTSGWQAVDGQLKLSVDGRRSVVTVAVHHLVIRSSKGDRVGANKVIRFAATIHSSAS